MMMFCHLCFVLADRFSFRHIVQNYVFLTIVDQADQNTANNVFGICYN